MLIGVVPAVKPPLHIETIVLRIVAMTK